MPQVDREITFYFNSLSYLLSNLSAKQRGITTHSPTDPNNESSWLDSKGWLTWKDLDGDLQIAATQKYYDVSSAIWVRANNVFGDLEFGEGYVGDGLTDGDLTIPIPISQTGVSALDGAFTATSIVGCLNELKNDVATPSNFWEPASGTVVRPKDPYISIHTKNGLMDDYAGNTPLSETGTAGLSGAFDAISLIGALNELKATSGILEKNGFDNRTDSAISYVTGTKVFTIELAYEMVSYGFYSDNNRFEYTASHNVTLLASTSMQFIYFDGNGVLQVSQTWSDTLVEQDALVAIILLDGTGGVVGFGDERHGHVMASRTHMYLHGTIGMAFESGLGLTGMSVDGTGNVDVDAQFGVANGILWDEDNKFTLNDTVPQIMSPIILLKKLWKSSTSWERTVASYFPVVTTGTGRAAYNDVVSGTLVEVTDGDFVLAHLFGSVDVDEPLEVMIGQAEYSTEQAAIAGAKTEIVNLYTAGLIVAEMKFIATVLLKTKNTYTNAVKSKIISISDTEDYIDWRFTNFSPGGGVASDSFWSRDITNGSVYPLTITDNVGIGGIPTVGWSGATVLELTDTAIGLNGSVFIRDADSNLYEGHNVYYDGTNFRRTAGGPSWLKRSGGSIYDIKYAVSGAPDAIIDSLLTSRMKLAATEIIFNEDQENINTIFSSDTEVNALHIDGSTGFVGIHKSSPSYHLDMQDDSDIYTRIMTIGNASVGLQLRRDEQLGSYNDNWIIRMDASSTMLNFWNGSNLMRIAANGNVSIGPGDPSNKLTIITDVTEISGIETKKDTVSTTFLGDGGAITEAKGMLMLKDAGSIKVYLASSYDSYLNGGNLGIGTSNPLDDVGTAAGDFTGVGLHIKNTVANGTGYLIVEGEGAAANGSSGIGAAQIIFSSTIGAVGNKLYSISGGGDILTFNSLNDDMTVKSSIMRLHNDGLVAINKSTDPSETLDVVGGVKIGSAENTNDGTMQWTGTDFEGRKSGAWVSLTSAGGGISQYSMKAGRSTSWDTHTWEADELIPLNTEFYDDGNNWNPSTYIYTNGPTAAHGNAALNVRFSASTGGRVKIMIKHNSTYVANQAIYVNVASEVSISLSCNIKLAASDTLSCYITHNTGLAINVKSGNGTYLTVHKINE